MLAANCADALARYKSVTKAFHLVTIGDFQQRSVQEIDECEPYQAAVVDEASKPSGALMEYDRFLAKFPQSVLVKPAQEHMAGLLKGQPAGVVSEAACAKLADLAKTAGMNKADIDAAMPEFYSACGAFYTGGNNNEAAYKMTVVHEGAQQASAAPPHA